MQRIKKALAQLVCVDVLAKFVSADSSLYAEWWQFPITNNGEQYKGENKKDIERAGNFAHSAIYEKLKAHNLGEERDQVNVQSTINGN